MEIPLTQGKVAVIDDDDAVLVGRYKWFAMKHYSGKRWYASAKVNGKRVSLHRFLTGYPMTDHKNGDSLDNRRENLRPCTNQQNQFNRNKQAGSSRFKGVTFYKRDGIWLAQIQKTGPNGRKNHRLGTFKTEEEAAAAYQAAATKLFGEFARF